MTTTVRVLTRARQLIEQGWTQGCHARNQYGKVLDTFTSPDAHYYCGDGAVLRAGYEIGVDPMGAQRMIRDVSAPYRRGVGFTVWQDSLSNPQMVLMVFDQAIADAQREAA